MAENIFFGAKKSFLQSLVWVDMICMHQTVLTNEEVQVIIEKASANRHFGKVFFTDSRIPKLQKHFVKNTCHHFSNQATSTIRQPRPQKIGWKRILHRFHEWYKVECRHAGSELPNHGNWIAHLLDVCERKSHVSFLARNMFLGYLTLEILLFGCDLTKNVEWTCWATR